MYPHTDHRLNEFKAECFFLTIIFFGGRITNASAILALRRRAWSTTNSFLIGVMPRGAITSASSIGRAQKHRPVARRSIFDGLTTRTDGWEVKIGNPACFKCYLCRQPLMQALASGQILPDGSYPACRGELFDGCSACRRTTSVCICACMATSWNKIVSSDAFLEIEAGAW